MKARGVFLRLVIFLAAAAMLTIIFTLLGRFFSFSGLPRFTLPLAVLCGFPFVALSSGKGGAVLSFFLILIVSFLGLYFALPTLSEGRLKDTSKKLSAAYGRAKEGVFNPVKGGHSFSRHGKTVYIIETEEPGPRIRETALEAIAPVTEPSASFPLTPVLRDAGFITERMSRLSGENKGRFAMYLFGILLFSSAALLLSSISSWPAFNFFVCILFVKLLLLLHRFFESSMFGDVILFFARFTRLSAENILLLGGSVLMLLLSLLHYARHTGKNG